MNQTNTDVKNVYLTSKPRYEILDGLRGVAALIVLAFHLLEVASRETMLTDYIGHGYLAVDFFFILSGFVIGYAYDDRWDRMSLWSFFKRRLIRLHPMIVFSTVVGVAFFYFGMGDMFPLIEHTGVLPLLLLTVFSLLMLPAPVSLDIRGWQETNPINGNAWSLFFEYVANILYALVIRFFPKWLLAVFVVLCAVLTADLALNLDLFGFLAERTHGMYTVHGGWSLTAEQMYLGFARLLYPFFAGLLMAKMQVAIRTGRSFWLVSLLLAAVLFVPPLGGEAPSICNGIYEAVAILAFFPLIVAMGAGGTVTGRSAAVCKWLGDISYPLYIVHYPIVFTLLGAWHKAHPEATAGQQWVISIGMGLLSIFIAQAALKLYDIPVREWLQRKLFPRRGK